MNTVAEIAISIAIVVPVLVVYWIAFARWLRKHNNGERTGPYHLE